MTFGQLFLYCYRQMEGTNVEDHPTPLFMDSVDVRSIRLRATDEIPAPKCLGDLIKLFLGARPRLWKAPAALGRMRGYPVKVQRPEEYVINHVSALSLNLQSMKDSNVFWAYAVIDELMDNGRDVREVLNARKSLRSEHDPQFERFKAMKIFDVLKWDRFHCDMTANESIKELMGLDWFKMFLNYVTPYYPILITAMVTCGLGLSAIEWARYNLTPVLITFRNESHLALVRRDIADQEGAEYFLVKIEKSFARITPGRLVIRNLVDRERYHMCLFFNLDRQEW